LHQGVAAVPDPQHPEFYEIELGDRWFYIHIPSRITGVYLVAAGLTREAAETGRPIAYLRNPAACAE